MMYMFVGRHKNGRLKIKLLQKKGCSFHEIKFRLAGEHRQAVDLSNESAGENGFLQEEALASDPCHGKRPDGRAS